MGISERLRCMDRWAWLAVIALFLFAFAVGARFASLRQPFVLTEDQKGDVVAIARHELGAEGNYTIVGVGLLIETPQGTRTVAHVQYEGEGRTALLTVDLDGRAVVQRTEARGWMAQWPWSAPSGPRWAHDRLLGGPGVPGPFKGAPGPAGRWRGAPAAGPLTGLVVLALALVGLVHVVRRHGPRGGAPEGRRLEMDEPGDAEAGAGAAEEPSGRGPRRRARV